MSAVIKYGMGNQLTRNVDGQNVRCVRTNRDYQAALGFGDNVDTFVNGVRVSDDYIIANGDVISFQDRAASKA